jgi:ABC-type multidrug transport system permease subunit
MLVLYHVYSESRIDSNDGSEYFHPIIFFKLTSLMIYVLSFVYYNFMALCLSSTQQFSFILRVACPHTGSSCFYPLEGRT